MDKRLPGRQVKRERERKGERERKNERGQVGEGRDRQ
jgi:hypothetical protein